MPSSLGGLPYAMHKTPVDSRDTRDLPFVHRLHEELQVLERGRGQHPMPEIEDVSRLSAGTAEDVADALAQQLWRAEQHRRVQVALDAAIVADPLPARLERDAPVKRKDVGPRRCDRLEQGRGVRAEMNPGYVQRGKRVEDRAGVGEDP